MGLLLGEDQVHLGEQVLAGGCVVGRGPVLLGPSTPDEGALNDAVLLAGSIARSVRVRVVGKAGGEAVDAGVPVDEGATGGAGETAPDDTTLDDATSDAGQPADDDATLDHATLDDATGDAGETASGGAPAAKPASLGVVLPDGRPLPAGVTLLGRGPRRTAERPADHTVTLPDSSISRAHLALRVSDGTVTATDLHSTDGTLVRRRDGAILALVSGEETELVAGGEVNFGAALLRVVEQP